MSLYTGLCKYEGIVQAIIALSGYAIPMTIPQNRLKIPVLMYHGANDKQITLQYSQRSSKNIANCNLLFEVHPTMGHEVYPEEYDFIRTWLKTNLLLTN